MDDAWRWWLREFCALLPELPAGQYFPARRRLLLRASPLETEITVVRGSSVEWKECIAHPAATGSAARLRAQFEAKYRGLAGSATGLLAEETVLRTALRLPRAAGRHLEEAVSYQIERISPFLPSNTLYAVRSQSEDEASGEVNAEVLITAKEFVDAIDERASALGLGVAAFAIEASGTAGLEMISFASRENLPGGFPLRYRALLAASVFLAGTFLIAPIVSQKRALAAVEEEIAGLKPQAEQAGKLRADREKHLSLLTEAVALKRSTPSPLAVLTKLSAELDDKTFLLDLRLEGAKVTISGVSSDASGLAQRLGTLADFKSVRFQGAVTRDPQTSRDRFTLALELASPS